jgi:hypothetical protein
LFFYFSWSLKYGPGIYASATIMSSFVTFKFFKKMFSIKNLSFSKKFTTLTLTAVFPAILVGNYYHLIIIDTANAFLRRTVLITILVLMLIIFIYDYFYL